MTTSITVSLSKTEATKFECAKVLLEIAGREGPVELDLDVTALLAATRVVPDLGQDFLFIAAVVYAVDKAVSRATTEDQWTRDLHVTIPIRHASEWGNVADDLSSCIGFLTGDNWHLEFKSTDDGIVRKRKRRGRLPVAPPDVATVCLFSGGLDSFIGALDRLVAKSDARLLCVGHYDRDVNGPGKDQRDLIAILQAKFPGRLDFAQARAGIIGKGQDINFRSRSLLFLAMGLYFADTIPAPVPLLIPENGPIALNFPLTPSRRGSCSTRTVHPDFIRRLNDVLQRVGFRHEISNPYELQTKGEMVKGCRDQQTLERAHAITRSCAKFHHRRHWINRKARGCGICVPCLFRRAALHMASQDNEIYGVPVETVATLKAATADGLAMCAFLRRDLDSAAIARGLLANGSLPIDRLPDYVSLIERMRAEVQDWLKAKGSAFLTGLAGI